MHQLDVFSILDVFISAAVRGTFVLVGHSTVVWKCWQYPRVWGKVSFVSCFSKWFIANTRFGNTNLNARSICKALGIHSESEGTNAYFGLLPRTVAQVAAGACIHLNS